MIQTNNKPRVLVIHSGARHNYALPSAFAEAGMLEAFYTDMCAGRGLGRLAWIAQALPLPEKPKTALRRLNQRQVPENALARTRTADFCAIHHELARGLSRTKEGLTKALLANYDRLGKTFCDWGFGTATHIFNVFGEGDQLLRVAKAAGVRIVSDVIIAPSTHRIVMEEYDAFPDWGPKPDGHATWPGGGHGAPLPEEMQLPDVFLCPSAFVAEDLRSNWGVNPNALRQVPYAVDNSWFQIVSQPQVGRVLFVGSADRRKGIHYLAKAAELLRKRSSLYEFRVAGGVDVAVLKHSASKGLTFLGRVPRFAIKEEFAQADIMVLPTLAEGSATVVYESLAAGVPVVTTVAAGSIVRNGEDGIIVPERNADALADAIATIVCDRQLRDTYARAARRRASNYTWKSYGNALRQIAIESI